MKGKATPIGLGRTSMALGAKDPRSHRNVQASQDSTKRYGKGLSVSNDGRLGVQQVASVEELPVGTNLETLIAAFNRLVRALREAEHMEGL